jgi:hypothetical protein
MKIAMYDLEGHLLEVFEVETVRDLESQLKTPKGGINNCITGHCIQTINMQFRKYSDFAKIIKRIGDITNIPGKTSLLPVSKYYKGSFICTYENATIAAKKNNLDTPNINRCLKNDRNTSGGFEWKYAN